MGYSIVCDFCGKSCLSDRFRVKTWRGSACASAQERSDAIEFDACNVCAPLIKRFLSGHVRVVNVGMLVRLAAEVRAQGRVLRAPEEINYSLGWRNGMDLAADMLENSAKAYMLDLSRQVPAKEPTDG